MRVSNNRGHMVCTSLIGVLFWVVIGVAIVKAFG
jgi:hypothetical protein